MSQFMRFQALVGMCNKMNDQPTSNFKQFEKAVLVVPRNHEFIQGNSKYPKIPSLRLLYLNAWIVVGILVTLLLVYAGTEQWRRVQLLHNNSAQARGTYVKRHISTGENSETYYVTARYRVNDDLIERSFQVSERYYNQADNGEPLRVIYAIDNPHIAALEAPVLWNLYIVTGFYGVVNITFWGWLLARIATAIKRRILLKYRSELRQGWLQNYRYDRKNNMLFISYSVLPPGEQLSVYGRVAYRRHDLHKHTDAELALLFGTLKTLAIAYVNKQVHTAL